MKYRVAILFFHLYTKSPDQIETRRENSLAPLKKNEQCKLYCIGNLTEMT